MSAGLFLPIPLRIGIRKSGNAVWPVGYVVTTAGNDLLHTLPQDPASTDHRSAIIRKILCYNNTGANVTLQFGTLTNAAVFRQLIPTLVAVNAFDNEWNEDDLPMVEFQNDWRAGAVGQTGDIYVLASAALAMVSIEVEEFGG